MKNISILLILLILLIPEIGTAQTPRVSFCTELDVLPYLSGGYYLSAGVGFQNMRLRGIVTHVFPPEFATPAGFENYELQVWAGIVDYFLGAKAQKREGFWIGTGLEFWKSKLTNASDSETGTFRNTIFTVGGGYVWRFYKKLYLNPWLAGHLPLGKATQQIGNRSFESRRFTPEASLKIGITF